MAIRITLESFLAVLQRSGLVAKESLDASLERFKETGGVTKEARPFAEYLLAQKVLTRWQTEKLLQGKHKGFFLGRYRLLDLLGKGGMSSVYLAEHTLMRRRCAIKVLPAKWVKTDTSYLGRFHREAQAVAALDHPNIVRAYDVDHEIDNDMEIHFLVMEYVEGKNLVEIIVERGRLPIREAVEFIRQASLGVGHAHRAGLVHRDIKPGNLLVDLSGVVKILDLGLAKFFSGDEASLTVQHDERVLGTADYLAPEQAVDSHSVDSRADIYSLGCSLYFLLTGHPPFNEGTLAQRLIAHQTREPAAIEIERDDIPENLQNLIRKMMAKNPDDRYQTADEAAHALGEWLKSADESPSQVSPPTGQLKSTPVKPVGGANTPRVRPTAEPAESSRRKPSGPPSKQKGSTPQRKPAPATDAVAKAGSGVGTLVGDNDLGSFLAQLDASAVETDVTESPSVSDQSAPLTSSLAKPSEPATRVESPADQEAPAGGLKETRREMSAVPLTSDATKSRDESAEPPLSPTSETAGQSSTQEEYQSAKRSLKVPVIAGGSVLGVVLILVFSGILPIGNDDTPQDPSNVGTGADPENVGDGRPQPVIGEDILVGPEGHFATISAAIDFVRTNVRSGGTIEQSIVVASGIYADRIVIDNTGRQSLPRGLRIICNDTAPAILNPTGFRIQSYRSMGPRGLRLKTSWSRPAIALLQCIWGATASIRSCDDSRIQGVTTVGIEAVGVSGISGQRLLLDSIRHHGRQLRGNRDEVYCGPARHTRY